MKGTPAARDLSRCGGAIMNAYGKGTTWQLMDAAFDRMRAAGVTPDVTTYKLPHDQTPTLRTPCGGGGLAGALTGAV